jgi:ABC-type molybdate transport system substrate-binding protein
MKKLMIAATIFLSGQMAHAAEIQVMSSNAIREVYLELVPQLKGIDYVGPLPPDIQSITVFSAGTHAGAKQAEAAKAWTRFLTSPAAAPVIRKKGMEPA